MYKKLNIIYVTMKGNIIICTTDQIYMEAQKVGEILTSVGSKTFPFGIN